VGAGRSDSLTVGIENRDLITVVALAVKYEFVPAIAMRAGCHSSFSMKRGGGRRPDSPPDELSSAASITILIVVTVFDCPEGRMGTLIQWRTNFLARNIVI
jgi:hypothetical protein